MFLLLLILLILALILLITRLFKAPTSIPCWTLLLDPKDSLLRFANQFPEIPVSWLKNPKSPLTFSTGRFTLTESHSSQITIYHITPDEHGEDVASLIDQMDEWGVVGASSSSPSLFVAATINWNIGHASQEDWHSFQTQFYRWIFRSSPPETWEEYARFQLRSGGRCYMRLVTEDLNVARRLTQTWNSLITNDAFVEASALAGLAEHVRFNMTVADGVAHLHLNVQGQYCVLDLIDDPNIQLVAGRKYSYGALWMSLATILIPGSSIADAYKDKGDEFASAFGIYLITWFIFTFLLMVVTLRKAVAFIILFTLLSITFAILAAAQFSGKPFIGKMGGWFGVATAFAAYYIGLSQLLAGEKNALFMLPIGAFSD